LEITATVNASGDHKNVAEVTASDAADPDSTPGNNDPGEDDQDSATVGVNNAPVANDDHGTGQIGQSVTLPVTGNDTDSDGTIDPTTVNFDPASVPGGTGQDTDGDGDIDQVTVPGEGTWTVDDSGNVTFTPEPGFTGDPTPITYTVKDNDGLASNPATITIDYPQADLSLNKTVSPTAANPGDTVTFTVTLTNNGPDTATNVEVTDQLPAGYTYVSHTATAGTSYDSGTGKWTVPSLASTASVTLEITATVNASGDHKNVAEVTASDAADPDSTPGNNDPGEDDQDDAVLNLISTADLELHKQVTPTSAGPGDQVTFVVEVINHGPMEATNVEITDQLPSGYTFVSASADVGNYDSSTGVWSLPSVAVGQLVKLRIVAEVRDTGNYVNVAEVTASDQEDPDSTPGNGDPNEDDYDTAGINLEAHLLLSKTVQPRRARVGDLVTYTITLTNPHTVPVHFDLVDAYAKGLTFAGMIEGPAPSVTKPVMKWSLLLDAKKSLTLRYRMRVGPTASQTLRNTARATWNGNGVPVAEVQGTALLSISDPMFAERRGTLIGRVFIDVNRNGAFDEGEDTGLPDARIVLSNGRQTHTDAEGRYAFRDLEPGVWVVGLDQTSAPLKPLPHPEAVGKGYVHRVNVFGLTVSDFPLMPPSGWIKGYRSTVVVLGPVRMEKQLIPMGEGRARVLLRIRSSVPINVVIEDPLPWGGVKRFRLEEFVGEKTFSYDLDGKVQLTDPTIRWGQQ